MRLVLATEKLVVQGRSFAGFPLLISAGKPVEPAQTFLWELLTRSGCRQSKLTWEKYGRSLFDFFAFCEANGADWRAEATGGLPSTIDWYRDWAKGEVKNTARTINERLRLLVRLYEWALKKGLISRLPFDYTEVWSGRPPGLLAHVANNKVQRPDVLLREHQQPPEFLTREQVQLCLADLTNETHYQMFALMVRTGLRQVECRTFPLKYVFDPARRKDLVRGQFIRLSLKPRDLKLKFDRPRDIDVPYSLMEDLWWYSIRHRPKRARMSESRGLSLFLTEKGLQYGQTSLTDIFERLEQRLGFRVRSHMARHCYATYTLMSLRRSNYEGDPLLYIRDRLGHKNLASTSVYLHLINQLASELVLKHEAELEELFAPKK
jgi:integrase/recombinase XerD